MIFSSMALLDGSLGAGMTQSIIAAIALGFSDYIVSKFISRLGNLSLALLLIELVGLFAVGVFGLLDRPEEFARVLSMDWNTWGLLLALGVVNYLATRVFYIALEKGPLSIVSPISSGFAVVTILLSKFVSGETAPLATNLGAFGMTIGVVLMVARRQRNPGERETGSLVGKARKWVSVLKLSGLWYAVVSAVLLGVVFWMLKLSVEQAGTYPSVASMRFFPFIIAAFALILRRVFQPSPAAIERQPINWKRLASAIGVLVIIASLDTLAFYAYGEGSKELYGSLESAVVSSYALLTVYLAKRTGNIEEKWSPLQWVGVASYVVCAILAQAPLY